MDELKSVYSKVIDEHRSWLKPFGQQYLNKWERLLKNQPESAICEASTRKLLSDHDIKVEPNEDTSSGGPDFLCKKKDKSFYVETTCITKEKATQKTGLTDKPAGVEAYNPLTRAILGEICNKTPQCSNLGAPCIIAIGTLHPVVGHICFSKSHAGLLLTGSTKIATQFDSEKGRATGELYQITELEDSAFVRLTKNSHDKIECARNPVSAVFLCSFGTLPPRVLGVLHPNPNHSFDRSLLPAIKFCTLADGYQTGQFSVEWFNYT